MIASSHPTFPNTDIYKQMVQPTFQFFHSLLLLDMGKNRYSIFQKYDF